MFPEDQQLAIERKSRDILPAPGEDRQPLQLPTQLPQMHWQEASTLLLAFDQSRMLQRAWREVEMVLQQGAQGTLIHRNPGFIDFHSGTTFLF